MGIKSDARRMTIMTKKSCEAARRESITNVNTARRETLMMNSNFFPLKEIELSVDPVKKKGRGKKERNIF